MNVRVLLIWCAVVVCGLLVAIAAQRKRRRDMDITAAVQKIKDAMAKNRSLIGSAVAFIHGLADQLNALRQTGASAEDISNLADELTAQDIDLANALVANTSAAGSAVPTDAVPGGVVTKAEVIEAADPTAAPKPEADPGVGTPDAPPAA